MTAPVHAIYDRPLGEPAPHGFEEIVLGMGCYWGVERLFWQQDGVWLTEVGFAGGTVIDHQVMTHPDLKAVNTAKNQDEVKPKKGEGASVANGKLSVKLPPYSYQMVRVKL